MWKYLTYLKRVIMTALKFSFTSLLASFEGSTNTHKNGFISKAYLNFKGLLTKAYKKTRLGIDKINYHG